MVAFQALNADEMKALNDMLTVKINERIKKDSEADKGKKKTSKKKFMAKETSEADEWGSFSRGSGGASGASNKAAETYAMDDDYDFM